MLINFLNILKLINRIRVYKIPFYLLRFFLCFFYSNLKLGYWDKTWRFHSLPLIQKNQDSLIMIGKGFVACSNAKNNTIGVFQKVILKTCGRGASLIIGDNVKISGAVISSMAHISIGNNVLIGSGVLITDNDAHPIHPDLRHDDNRILKSPIVIEDNVFIGARSIILKGVSIGEGSIIGAGSVVTKNVPKYSIFAGNPARIIGDVREIKT